MMKKWPKIYQFPLRFPKTILLLCLLLSLLSFFFAKKLKVEGNLMGLLPQNTESVKNLEELEHHFGGRGFLTLTVQGAPSDETEAMIGELIARLEKHPDVRYVEYKKPLSFFKSREWLFLDLGDLKEMERRIDQTLELQKKGIAATFSKWMNLADSEDLPDLSFKDLLKKYEEKAQILGWKIQKSSKKDQAENLWVIQVKAKDHAENLDSTRRFLSDIDALIKSIQENPNYHDLRVGFTGPYQRSIEDADQTNREVAVVSTLVTVALFIILFLYFRNFSSIFLIAVPLMVGVIWTGGVLYLTFGHLSIITAFGAAILAGLGSDYGIYLLSRYYQERHAGRDFRESCALAFGNTGKSTYASMVVTVGGFVALLFSDFGVFREFGLLGAVGLFANYVAMMLLMPALLYFWEKFSKGKIHFFQWEGLHRLLARTTLADRFTRLFLPRGAVLGVLLALFLCMIASFSIPAQSKIYFEDGQLSSGPKPSDALQHKVNEVIRPTLSPTILMVKGKAEEEQTTRKIEKFVQENASNQRLFTGVLGISSFVPMDQAEKKEVLKRIRDKFEDVRLIVKKRQGKLLASMDETIQAEPITPHNLPIEVRRNFSSFRDPHLFAVFLFPADGSSSSENIKRLREGVFSLREKLGLSFTPADPNFIADDTVRLIEKEAPKGMILILVFLTLVLFMMVRPPARAAMIVLNLMGSLIILSGILWLFKFHLNVINIAVFPIILGTAVDCFIHLSHHFDELGDMDETMRQEIGPILVSNLTSIIGFGGLLITSSVGLRSVGWVAVLGLSIVTFFCAFVFPRCILLEYTRKIDPLKLKSEPAQI